ncbi:MAG: hypothetical protein ACRC7N_00660 [Clostridium sp.]
MDKSVAEIREEIEVMNAKVISLARLGKTGCYIALVIMILILALAIV